MKYNKTVKRYAEKYYIDCGNMVISYQTKLRQSSKKGLIILNISTRKKLSYTWIRTPGSGSTRLMPVLLRVHSLNNYTCLV